MTPTEFKTAKPTHLAVVEWFSLYTHFLERAGIQHHRATFYLERVPWGEHPWGSDGERRGADFENHWTLEKWCDCYWRAEGRTDDGWRALRLVAESFDTPEAALDELLSRLSIAIDRRECEVNEIKARWRHLDSKRKGGKG